MNRLAVLSNAASGANVARRQALTWLAGLSGVQHLHSEHPEALPDLLQQLLQERPAVLAVNGGDGTLQGVLTCLLEHPQWCAMSPRQRPLLAALPGGSTNMSARDLGSGVRLRPALERLLRLRDRPLDQWPVRRRALVQVHDGTGAMQAGLFFGLGTIVRGVEFWQAALKRSLRVGEWSAGLALLRGAWGIIRRQPPFADSTRVRVVLPQQTAEHEVLFLLVSTMERLFLGLRPFWGEGGAPLAVTWVQDPAHRFVRHLPALLRGRGERLAPEHGYHSARSQELRLEFADRWLIDGELFAGPGPLRLQATAPLSFVPLLEVDA